MFDIGFWELLVIAVVLMLVMGPERLPEVAKQAAFLLRKARQGMYRLRNEMQSEISGTPFADLEDARQEVANFKDDIKQLGRELADSHETSLENYKEADIPSSYQEKPETEETKPAATKKNVVKRKVKKKAKKKTTKKKVSKKKTASKKKKTSVSKKTSNDESS